jgi:hypothetical protein
MSLTKLPARNGNVANIFLRCEYTALAFGLSMKVPPRKSPTDWVGSSVYPSFTASCQPVQLHKNKITTTYVTISGGFKWLILPPPPLILQHHNNISKMNKHVPYVKCIRFYMDRHMRLQAWPVLDGLVQFYNFGILSRTKF